VKINYINILNAYNGIWRNGEDGETLGWRNSNQMEKEASKK